MQNERSGARRQHQKDKDVLSPIEAAALDRGQDLKRYVRAAAALKDLYDDTAIAEKVGVKRGTVGGWWEGAQMKPDTIRRLADATGMSLDELMEFVHFGGPPPSLPDPATVSIREGLHRAEERLAGEDPSTPTPQLERRSRGTGAGRG